VDEERIEESELDLLRQSLWACLHGLISLPAIRPDLVWPKDLLEASVDRILKGWLSASGAGGVEKRIGGVDGRK
jgi:hypothetical protein